MRRLAEADLVLTTRLASEGEGLRPARPLVLVARACRQSIDQESVNRLLIGTLAAGRHVVRPKSGDPFVFGRGGEEALPPGAGIPSRSSCVVGCRRPGLAGILSPTAASPPASP
jgi:hypothetical protein